MIDSLPGLPHIYRNAVSASYFKLMNLPFVNGRTFLPEEQKTVIVSESTARAVWPNQNPVGKTWTFAGFDRVVTGVVKDSGANLLADPESVEAYVPIQDRDIEQSALILHARSDPGAVMRVLRATTAPGEAFSVILMRSSREHLLDASQKMVTLIGSIGLVSTALAAAGMFALVAFAVVQRKRELGIRIAVGAGPRHILSTLLRQNLSPTLSGAVVGTALAAILSRLVRSLVRLQRHDTVDLLGFAVGLLCFAFVAVLASLSPAIRALRIDPSATLREE
jgi:hypothetical protein